MLHRQGMQALADRIHAMTTGGGQTVISIKGWWRHQLKWSQNRLVGASEIRDYSVSIGRTVGGGTAARSTNHLTDDALAETVRLVERAAAGAAKYPRVATMSVSGTPQQRPTPAIWSERSAQLTAEERATLGTAIANACEKHHVISSGILDVRGQEQMGFIYGTVLGDIVSGDTNGDPGDNNPPHAEPQKPESGPDTETGEDESKLNAERGYVCYTSTFCRIATSGRDGSGVGWGGASRYDWGAIDTTTIVNEAVARCMISRNPIRIEPGRYPVVLDPQAVAVLVNTLVNTSHALDRQSAESGRSPFTQSPDQQLQLYRTKLGMKVIDERLTLRHDPLDPRLGVLPSPGLRAVTWIDKGVLTNLAYSRAYAVQRLQQETSNLMRPSFMLEGGNTDSLDDLIAKTSKGLLLTRLANVQLLTASLLMTGEALGLCQIDNGKLTRAVLPMRFTDSPLLAFNAVEQIGASVPVFAAPERGVTPVIVPPMSIREFALTATTTFQP